MTTIFILVLALLVITVIVDIRHCNERDMWKQRANDHLEMLKSVRNDLGRFEKDLNERDEAFRRAGLTFQRRASLVVVPVPKEKAKKSL